MKQTHPNKQTQQDPFLQQSYRTQQLKPQLHIPRIQPSQPHVFSTLPHVQQPGKNKKITIQPIQIPMTSRNPLSETTARSQSLQKLLKLNTQRKTSPSQPSQPSHYQKASQKSLKQKTASIKQYLQQHENKKLVEAIRSHEVDKKGFKKKLAAEVGEYVKLREHMQKFKKEFNVVVKKGVEGKERQNSMVFKRFLTEAIEETKRKMLPQEQYESKTTTYQ